MKASSKDHLCRSGNSANMLKRNSSIELMRIVCIILVILSHFAEKSYFEDGSSMITRQFNPNTIPAYLIGMWGGVGVCGFIAISSYFMIDDNRGNTVEKAYDIWLQTWIYSLFFSGLSIVVLKKINVKLIIKEVTTPFYTKQYWFVSAYCLFILVVPILNMTLKLMKQKELKILCLILLYIRIQVLFFDEIVGALSLFITIYYWTAYFKKNIRISGKRIFSILLPLFCAKFFSVLLCNIIGTCVGSDTILGLIIRLKNSCNPIDLMIGVAMLFFTVKFNINNNTMNRLAKHTFGIYLIQSNLVFIEGVDSLLFNKIFRIHTYIHSPVYVIIVAVDTIICFMCCNAISFLIDFIIMKRIRKNRINVSIKKYIVENGL